jgi:serine/threonine-protein kinase
VKPPVQPQLSPTGRVKPKRNRWIWALILYLLLGFAAGAFLAFGKFWSLNEVIVPNVVGKNVDAAKTMIVSKNLRVNVSEVFNAKVPAGIVISQSPEGGATVKEQRQITIIVSKGGEVTIVPDVRGMNRRDAELQIKNLGLAVGRIDEQFSNDVPADQVISQNPRPPAQVNKGTAIDLVVSKGAGPRKLVLPDFRGTPLNTVSSQLESLKLIMGKVTEVANDKYPAGTIIDQSPAPASEVAEGAEIDFNVAKSSAGTVKRAAVQITVPEGPIRQSVQVVVTDSNGRRVIYEGVHKPGDRIDKTVEGVGQIRVQVYINGVLLQEQTL